jgi:hypothetical protein
MPIMQELDGMAKLPGFMFYPGDWLRDSISGCSLAAQGLWLRMMIIAHDSDRYGYLTTNGVAIPPGSIAQRCGCTLEQYTTLIDELTIAGVVSRSADGSAIYSRRMARDGRLRDIRSKCGKLGGRPPKYKTEKGVKRKSKTKANSNQITEYESENEYELVVNNSFKRKPSNYEELFNFVVSECKFTDSDAEYLWNHWNGNGWINGKNPIVDWRSTVRAWIRAGHLPSQKTKFGQAKSPPSEYKPGLSPLEELEKKWLNK